MAATGQPPSGLWTDSDCQLADSRTAGVGSPRVVLRRFLGDSCRPAAGLSRGRCVAACERRCGQAASAPGESSGVAFFGAARRRRAWAPWMPLAGRRGIGVRGGVRRRRRRALGRGLRGRDRLAGRRAAAARLGRLLGGRSGVGGVGVRAGGRGGGRGVVGGRLGRRRRGTPTARLGLLRRRGVRGLDARVRACGGRCLGGLGARVRRVAGGRRRRRRVRCGGLAHGRIRRIRLRRGRRAATPRRLGLLPRRGLGRGASAPFASGPRLPPPRRSGGGGAPASGSVAGGRGLRRECEVRAVHGGRLGRLRRGRRGAPAAAARCRLLGRRGLAVGTLVGPGSRVGGGRAGVGCRRPAAPAAACPLLGRGLVRGRRRPRRGLHGCGGVEHGARGRLRKVVGDGRAPVRLGAGGRLAGLVRRRLLDARGLDELLAAASSTASVPVAWTATCAGTAAAPDSASTFLRRRRERRPLPFGKLRSSSRDSALGLRAMRVRAPRRTSSASGVWATAAASRAADSRRSCLRAACTRRRALRAWAPPDEFTSRPSSRLVSGQRWTAYSSCTSRVLSASARSRRWPGRGGRCASRPAPAA